MCVWCVCGVYVCVRVCGDCVCVCVCARVCVCQGLQGVGVTDAALAGVVSVRDLCTTRGTGDRGVKGK